MTSFVWAIAFWAVFQSGARSVNWPSLWLAIPSPLLLTIFIVALVKRNNVKVFAILVTTALVLIVGWTTYDYRHQNYQLFEHNMLGKPTHIYYFNWPWLSN